MTLGTLVSLGVLAAISAVVVVLIQRWRVAGVTTFLLVIAFVPIWVVVPTPFASPSVASWMAGLVAVALTFALPRGTFRWTFADLLASFLLVTAIGPALFGLIPISTALEILVIWCTAYVAGRMVLLHIDASLLYAIIAVIFGMVGFLALIEFFTGWHGLSSWGPANGAHVTWGPIQERGGSSRAEGAFGHSLALGGTLAMAAVLALQARLPKFVCLALIALMVGGVGVTLSRGPLACLGLGLVLALLFVREKRVRELRPAMAVMIIAGLVLLVPFVLGVFSKAGPEATVSAEYRGRLVSLLNVLEVVGRSAAIKVNPQGSTYINGFRSIDSQLLIFGLNFGWLMIGVVITLMIVLAIALVSGRGSAPGAAVVAQAPALLTVALITQYAVFFWFVLGMVMGAEQLRSRARPPGSDSASDGNSLATTDAGELEVR